MVEPDERTLLAGALKSYLQELNDSGVYELPNRSIEAGGRVDGEPIARLVEKPAAAETLDNIRTDLGDCRRCSLCGSRKNIVFGAGSLTAPLVFVGEAPGRDEDLQGEPFVGEAGQLLTKMIAAMGYQRSGVYICNLLKCRPPENRNPLAEEIALCSPFMHRQIIAVAPKAVVALGTFAAQTLLGSKEPVSRLRGKFHDYHGIPLMPTFHPAFLLRSPEKKREVWEDLQQVMKLLVK